MFSAFVNCIKIDELRRKVIITLVLLFVARIGANIPLPGIDTSPLSEFMLSRAANGGGLLGMFNMFTGGALMKGAIFGLGVMPYISASIILQLLAAINPSLARISQEGESGRQRIAQYTRYTTILICIIQGFLLVTALANYPEKLFYGFDSSRFGDIVIVNKTSFFITSTIFLTAGTMALMWLGDQITQYGIGNGVSLLITAGILSSMPTALSQAITLLRAPAGIEGGSLGLWHGLLMLVLLLSVVALMIAVTQADRRIPVQYVNRVVGRKMYGGQSSYLPLKINYSGVMPVIFASAILLFPQQIFAYIGASTGVNFFQKVSIALNHGSTTYYLIYGTMILCFSYFWVSMMFRPVQVADDLKKNGGYVPGVRPGNDTAKFLDFVMTRLTLAGALFLTLIALLPDFVCFVCGIPYSIALFFGGTGTLIAVGVILDTMKQVEGYLLQKNYDGFMKKGKFRSRSAVDSFKKGNSKFGGKFKVALYLVCAIIAVVALVRVFFG
ncbi:MAG: preprotein translocase subunit SecY [Puniceicoccales bacterium]|jgi:preprotein translocase subunit SecY|nr:preprotein translocase subunit SecY [Puniceicoccales bacterium]